MSRGFLRHGGRPRLRETKERWRGPSPQPEDALAAAMLLPYLAWGSFARTLNIAVWWNHGGAAG